MLASLLKGIQPKVECELLEIWLKESCDVANKPLNIFVGKIFSISISNSDKKAIEEQLTFHESRQIIEPQLKTTNSN